MANYIYTNEAGTSRRRAKTIVINNPSGGHGTPSVTFMMEDRILMADGKELFIDAGNLVLSLDDEMLAREYPRINVESGAINLNDKRTGVTIMQMIMQALTDVFITEGQNKDANE